MRTASGQKGQEPAVLLGLGALASASHLQAVLYNDWHAGSCLLPDKLPLTAKKSWPSEGFLVQPATESGVMHFTAQHSLYSPIQCSRLTQSSGGVPAESFVYAHCRRLTQNSGCTATRKTGKLWWHFGGLRAPRTC